MPRMFYRGGGRELSRENKSVPFLRGFDDPLTPAIQ